MTTDEKLWRLVRERNQARDEVERITRQRDAARAEAEGLREAIRTIRARCVELDDSDAVSATFDIANAVLDSTP